MKILFMQNTDDSLGGIVNVNISLMQKFIANGEEISLISLRHLGKKDKVNYPDELQNIVINEKDLWGCPRYKNAIEYLKQAKIVAFIKIIFARWKYDYCIKKDYEMCKRKIMQINPNIIINSHYELLEAIPECFLQRTVNHFHTSFNQVLENRSYMKIFEKYKDKIAKFVWLSRATCERAIESGLDNSIYIYNPLSFSSKLSTEITQKRAVFIGRFSEEKCLDRAVRLFCEVIAENGIEDWSFDIYGTGNLEDDVKKMVQQSAYVNVKGSTEHVRKTLLEYSIFILASRFEGMSLAVLEANECGLPVICFDFGESAQEEIIDGETGFVVAQDNEKMYKEKLCQLMYDVNLREKMGKNAKEFAVRFQIETIIKQWYELFQRINEDR